MPWVGVVSVSAMAQFTQNTQLESSKVGDDSGWLAVYKSFQSWGVPQELGSPVVFATDANVYRLLGPNTQCFCVLSSNGQGTGEYTYIQAVQGNLFELTLLV